MDTTVLSRVLDLVDDHNVHFVFPSDIAADSVMRAALRELASSGRHAIARSRFLGWDEFKTDIFSGHSAFAPANKAARLLFAYRFLDSDEARAGLPGILPPEGASSSFARPIAGALPLLSDLRKWTRRAAMTRRAGRRQSDTDPWDGPGPGLTDRSADGQDAYPFVIRVPVGQTDPDLASEPGTPGAYLHFWSRIRTAYSDFLREHRLYEPGWKTRTPRYDGRYWVLFYPDLVTDWYRYRRAINTMSNATCILSDTLPDGRIHAARFATVIQELRASLADMRERLEQGADPSSMLISVAGPDATMPLLEREARVAGVPLDPRTASTLADTTPGRLLSDILALARTDMSFGALRRLLLDGSRTWKDGAAARQLLDAGIRNHILATPRDVPGIWDAALVGLPDARALFRSLRLHALHLAAATSFEDVRTAFDAFRQKFLVQHWTPVQDSELATAIKALDDLRAISGRSTGAKAEAVPGAASIWLDFLGLVRYVPQSTSIGIPVYAFPVAAGSMPQVHYVMNLAQGAATQDESPMSFAGLNERIACMVKDRDLSAGLIALLSVSGATVYCSYADEGADGFQPPHPALVPVAPDQCGPGPAGSRWLPDADKRAVQVADRTVPVVFPLQAVCASAALATVFRNPSTDWTAGTAGSPVSMNGGARDAVIAGMTHREGLLRLSATSIEGYLGCPFRQLFGRFLGVEAIETGLSFLDNLVYGQLYHDAFSALFGTIGADGGRVRASAFVGAADVAGVAASGGAVGAGAADSAGSAAAGAGASTLVEGTADALPGASFGAAIARLERTHGILAAVLARTMAPYLENQFREAFRTLVGALDGLVPVMTDRDYLGVDLPDYGFELYGKPDLVCAEATAHDGREAVIVDYKKSVLPKKEELLPDADGHVAKIQIAQYDALVEGAGFVPRSAWYLSIEGTDGKKVPRLVCVFGSRDAIVSAEQYPGLRTALVSAASRTATLVREGSVFLPDPADRWSVCSHCDLKAVCRVNYTVR